MEKGKKIIIGLIVVSILMMLVGVIMYLGTLNTAKELDLSKASTSLMDLKSENIDRFVAEDNIMMLGNDTLNNMVYVYEYEMQDSGIDFMNIEEYTIKKSVDPNEMYAIVKPVEGKKDDVKGQVQNIFELAAIDGKVEVHEKGEYLVFLSTSMNEKILEEISTAYAPIFSGVQPLDKQGTIGTLGLNSEDVSDAMMLQSMLLVNSTTVVVVKPEDGKEEDVKAKMDEYFANSEKQWQTYLVDQYEIIKNRKVEEYGDYLIYIATDGQNDKVYETIINSEMDIVE